MGHPIIPLETLRVQSSRDPYIPFQWTAVALQLRTGIALRPPHPTLASSMHLVKWD